MNNVGRKRRRAIFVTNRDDKLAILNLKDIEMILQLPLCEGKKIIFKNKLLLINL